MDIGHSSRIFRHITFFHLPMILDNLYLFLDIFTLSFPLFRSFEHRLEYWKKWYALFPAILMMDVFYIIWDIIFTNKGIWGFNDRYLVDISLFHLPLEEWLFFVVVPFACIFIYEATLFYIKKDILGRIAKPFSLILGTLLLIIGVLNFGKAYTSLTFITTGLFLYLHVFIIKGKYLGRFYFGYIFSLIPFLLVNGVLTGSFIEDQIVWYNNAENLSIRIFTIPIEDSIYLLLYLLGITTVYEAILKRW